jgi:hypothetical protein
MASTKLFFITIGFFLLAPLFSSAQHLEVSPELKTRLEGKKRFNDIMNEVHNYYSSRNYHNNHTLFSEYKKWNRWAWWASRHLNSNGEVDADPKPYINEAARMNDLQQTNGVESNSGGWTPVGPSTTTWANAYGSRGIGRIDQIIFHPTNANIMLAGSPAGGLWRTTNGGLNWSSISSSVPNCGVSGIVINSNDPTGNTIYMLTGDGNSGGGYFLNNYGFERNSVGILVTTNGGITWNKLGNSEPQLSGKRPYKLLQMRNFPNVLFAATNSGLYKSADFGITWALVSASAAFDIEQHPINDAILYVATPFTVAKSADYGVSFTYSSVYNPVALGGTRTAVAVTAASPNEVYFLQCGGTNRIYRSADAGDNYNVINTTDLITGQYGYNCAFAINPFNKNFMAVGGIPLSASSDNGASFPSTTVGISPATNATNYLHPDVHDLAYNPLNGLLFAATDGGVFVSSDNGVNWADRSTGLQCTQYYRMDGFNGAANLYAGGSQDNGTTYTTNGNDMVYAGSGDGYAADFCNTNNDTFYLVENTTVTRFKRSTNNLVQISPGGAGTQTFYPDVACHPTKGNIVYVGYGNGIWRTNNSGTSWTQILATGNNNGTTGNRTAYSGGFGVSAAMPARVYAASNNTVRRSNDEGGAWVTVSGNTGWPASFGTITDIAVRPNDADEVWITTTGNNGANRVLYSSNAGASWANLTGTLPNIPVYAIAYTSDGDAYVGTELGVYFMDFAMNDWVPFYNGLPRIPVTDLFVDEINATVSAATLGRGIWRSDLYSNCSAFLTLGSSVQGSNFYQTGGILQSAQTMAGSFGNELRYRSPVKIRLTPGFAARDGSYLHAVIGPCGQGVFNKPETDKPLTKAAAGFVSAKE